jgi:hypothetical protein
MPLCASQDKCRVGQQPTLRMGVRSRCNASVGHELDEVISTLNSPKSEAHSRVNPNHYPAVYLTDSETIGQGSGTGSNQDQVGNEQAVLRLPLGMPTAHMMCGIAAQDESSHALQPFQHSAPLSTHEDHGKFTDMKTAINPLDNKLQANIEDAGNSLQPPAQHPVEPCLIPGATSRTVTTSQESTGSGDGGNGHVTALEAARKGVSQRTSPGFMGNIATPQNGPDTAEVIRVAAPNLDGTHMAALIARFRNAPPRQPPSHTGYVCTPPESHIAGIKSRATASASTPAKASVQQQQGGAHNINEPTTLQAAMGMCREPPHRRGGAFRVMSVPSALVRRTPVEACNVTALNTCQQQHVLNDDATPCLQGNVLQQCAGSGMRVQFQTNYVGHDVRHANVEATNLRSAAVGTTFQDLGKAAPLPVDNVFCPWRTLSTAAQLPAQHGQTLYPVRQSTDANTCNEALQKFGSSQNSHVLLAFPTASGHHQPCTPCQAVTTPTGSVATTAGYSQGLEQLQQRARGIAYLPTQDTSIVKEALHSGAPLLPSNSQISCTAENAQLHKSFEAPKRSEADPVQALLTRCRRLLSEGESSRSTGPVVSTTTGGKGGTAEASAVHQSRQSPAMSKYDPFIWFAV